MDTITSIFLFLSVIVAGICCLFAFKYISFSKRQSAENKQYRQNNENDNPEIIANRLIKAQQDSKNRKRRIAKNSGYFRCFT
jgi:hypothetical protein